MSANTTYTRGAICKQLASEALRKEDMLDFWKICTTFRCGDDLSLAHVPYGFMDERVACINFEQRTSRCAELDPACSTQQQQFYRPPTNQSDTDGQAAFDLQGRRDNLRRLLGSTSDLLIPGLGRT